MCKKHIHTNEKRALHDRIFMPTSWRSKHPDDEKCIGCLVLGELKEFTLLVYGRSPLLLVDGDSSNRKLLLPCMILPAQHPAYLFLHRNSHLLLNLSQVSCLPSSLSSYVNGIIFICIAENPQGKIVCCLRCPISRDKWSISQILRLCFLRAYTSRLHSQVLLLVPCCFRSPMVAIRFLLRQA